MPAQTSTYKPLGLGVSDLLHPEKLKVVSVQRDEPLAEPHLHEFVRGSWLGMPSTDVLHEPFGYTNTSAPLVFKVNGIRLLAPMFN